MYSPLTKFLQTFKLFVVVLSNLTIDLNRTVLSGSFNGFSNLVSLEIYLVSFTVFRRIILFGGLTNYPSGLGHSLARRFGYPTDRLTKLLCIRFKKWFN